ncbi:MAG: ATP-binding protein, partial [Sandaracinaceae bacterium]|nr:ATP-binding protein [Sandaracinaceae bacterium]
GELRPARGLLPQLADAVRRGLTTAVVPRAQLGEASLVEGIDVRGAHDLASVVAFLEGASELPRPAPSGMRVAEACLDDLADVQGQHVAKRALEIAAAGPHHLLLIKPPGTMLARRQTSAVLPVTQRMDGVSSSLCLGLQ